MKLTGKLVLLVIGAVITLLIVLAFPRGTDNSPYFGTTEPPRQARLTYNIMFEPSTIDPHVSVENASYLIVDAMFDGLTEYHPQTLEPIAALATQVEVNPDSTQFTFYLRGHASPKGTRLLTRDDLHQQFLSGQLSEDFARGHKSPPTDSPARWSDGRVITAHDFVYSWRRAVTPTLAAPNAFLLYAIKNAQSINARRARFRDNTTKELLRGKLNPDGTIVEDPSGPLISATASAMRRTPERYEALLKRAAPVPYQPDELGVRALDDFTFQVDLAQPTAFFLKMTPMSIFRVVPQQAIEPAKERADRKEGSVTDWLKPQNIVVSGAFKLAGRLPYDHLTLVKNPNYWDAATVELTEVKFLPIEDRVTALGLYKAGEVNLAMGGTLPPPFIKNLRDSKRDFFVGPATSVVFYVFNTTKKPFDDVRVRRALDMATDKAALTEFLGNGQVPQWRLTPTFPGYTPRATSRYDATEARRLLAEAGYPNGVGPDGQKLRCVISFATDEGNKRMGELIKSQWERNLGIEVELQNREGRAHMQALTQLQHDGVAYLNFSADYMDPNTYLELFLSESPINGGWKNARYDDLMHQANAEADMSKRMALLAEAEDYLMEQQIFIPLYVGVWSYVKKPYVRGVAHNLFDKHPLKFIWFDPDWERNQPLRAER